MRRNDSKFEIYLRVMDAGEKHSASLDWESVRRSFGVALAQMRHPALGVAHHALLPGRTPIASPHGFDWGGVPPTAAELSESEFLAVP